MNSDDDDEQQQVHDAFEKKRVYRQKDRQTDVRSLVRLASGGPGVRPL